MPFYEKGNVRIRYEETGSGFPLLVTPGGGLNSRVSNWPTAVFNAPPARDESLVPVCARQGLVLAGQTAASRAREARGGGLD